MKGGVCRLRSRGFERGANVPGGYVARRGIWNSLKRRTLVFVFALSKRRVVLASTVATRLRSVLVVATPKMKAMPFARHQSSTSGAHVWMPPLMQGFFCLSERVIGCGHVSGLTSAAFARRGPGW